MLKAEAIKKAGGVTNLSAILGVTKSAVSQWPDGPLPELRMYQLMALRPEWFAATATQNREERAESLALAAAYGAAD